MNRSHAITRETRDRPPLKTPMKIDHHLHTDRFSSDSVMTPEQLVETARLVGLDAVVITEHDALWPADQLAELAASAPDLLILNGVEISTRQGDMLVYGLPDMTDVGPGMELDELLDVAEARSAAVVAAHPYRFGQDFDRVLENFGHRIHALELVSNNIDARLRRRAAEVLRKNPALGATGSSDAHAARTLGCYYSILPEPVRTIREFADALIARKTVPAHNPRARAPLASGTVDEPRR